MRRVLFIATLLAAAAASSVAVASPDDTRTYVVLYERGASAEAARSAIAGAGGTIVSENAAVGVATVRSTSDRFAERAQLQAALVGAAANKPVGKTPRTLQRKPDPVEAFGAFGFGASAALRPAAPAAEPLAPLQWNMRMVNATARGSYARQRGSHAVRVGIVDSGIDATHPDIAANFDRGLSRNFTVDDPLIDGPCEEEPDGSCEDPADVDESGHGTHVAGIVGAALNGRGVAGVAPDARLVSLRAGQDSGYVFLKPVVDALTYAGDHGIDVVNMSFFIDRWWFNCGSNPADSPQEQLEQRIAVAATERAIAYARARGVTAIVSLGNDNIDLGKPMTDDLSPTYPPGSERTRTVDNGCRVMPAEANGAIGVTALGPSRRKAYYSNYGREQADVSGPGGDVRDWFGTPDYMSDENRVLSSFPESVGRESGMIDEDGNPTTPRIVKQAGAYYFWSQGTSMSAPHAVGVAALIVAEQGGLDRKFGGLTMSPADVEKSLRRGAMNTPCPTPPTLVYPDPDLGPEFNAKCEGTLSLNGFYGDGIVNALGYDK